jgi:hypothetical protein
VQKPAIDTNMVAFWIGLSPKFGHGSAVDGDTARRDQFFSLAPGSDPRSRDNLL